MARGPCQHGNTMKEKILRIIRTYQDGVDIRGAIASEGMDSFRFFETINADRELLRIYETAQLSKTELVVEEIIQIADDMNIDPFRAKIKIDARRWYASKMRPAKYGERVDVNHNHSVDIGAALNEARQRAALPDRDPILISSAQVLNITDNPNQVLSGYKPDEDEGIDIFS